MNQTSRFLQLIAALSFLEVAGSCGKIFTSSSGTVTSPAQERTSSYSNNLLCDYDIKVSGDAVRLQWLRFDIKGEMPSCAEDYVEIFVKCSRRSIGRYCSNNLQSLNDKLFDVYSPDQCLRLRFRSDSSTIGKGFEAYYSTISYSQGTRSLPDDCSDTETVYPSAGVISSPSWPNLSPSVRDCYWKIEVGSGNAIKIAIMDFDIEYEIGCEDNKVKIKGGDDDETYDSSLTIRTSMCGSVDPFSFSSSKKRIWIRFKSDAFKTYRGFVAGYVIYDESSGSSVSSSSTAGAVAGTLITVAIIVLFIFYVYRYRRRLAMLQQQATRTAALRNGQAQATTTQVNVSSQAVVHHPPPVAIPGYGAPPGASYSNPPPGYAPPPPVNYGPAPQSGSAPPSYDEVMAAMNQEPGKPGPSSLAQQAPQYPPGPFGRAYPHPTEGAAPYPPVQT